MAKKNRVKLKPTVKKKWIAALKSGRFEQANGNLKEQIFDKKIRHCCLGVLCEIYPSKITLIKDDDGGFIAVNKENARSKSGGYIPQQVADKFNLTKDTQRSLATMNDSGDYSFKDIANYIKENL